MRISTTARGDGDDSLFDENFLYTYDEATPGDPLAFTHQDLTLRNLMVDKKGQLWVVDWQSSGWYPAFFEYVGMHIFHTPDLEMAR